VQVGVVLKDILDRLSAITHLADVFDRQARVPEDRFAAEHAFPFFNPA
jgi:hypothetical protein